MKLSAIILARDEEEMIVDCLDSVSFCDEIIVIDHESTDNTVVLAKRNGALVYKTDMASFAQRRNLGLHKASGEWIIYVDSDERISKELAKEIYETVTKDSEYVSYAVLRKNIYFQRYEWPYRERIERLFLKSSFKGWYGDLHESPRIIGKVGTLNNFLLHYSHRDLSSMLDKTIAWSRIEAELRFHTNHPKMVWWRFFRVMLTGFLEYYVKQKGWKVGTAGLIESMYQAYSMFVTYARLWEMQHMKNSQKPNV